MKRTFTAVYSVWMGMASLAAAQTLYSDTLYHRLQKLYFLSVQSEQYLSQTEQVVEQLIQQHGPLPPLQMYKYGVLALKARYATNLLRKRDYLFESMAKMDAQVERTPDDPEVRFLRGSFYYYLPGFLGKKTAARTDINAIAELLLRNSSLYKERYQPQVLQAILGFISETGWVEESVIGQLRRIYFSP